MNFQSYGWAMFLGGLIGLGWGYLVNQAPIVKNHQVAIHMHGEP